MHSKGTKKKKEGIWNLKLFFNPRRNTIYIFDIPKDKNIFFIQFKYLIIGFRKKKELQSSLRKKEILNGTIKSQHMKKIASTLAQTQCRKTFCIMQMQRPSDITCIVFTNNDIPWHQYCKIFTLKILAQYLINAVFYTDDTQAYTVYRVIFARFCPACLHSKLFTESLIHPKKFVGFFLKNNKKRKIHPVLNLPCDKWCEKGKNKIVANIFIHTVHILYLIFWSCSIHLLMLKPKDLISFYPFLSLISNFHYKS